MLRVRCWVVDVVTCADRQVDITSRLRLSLSQQGSNEKPLNEGEVFCHVIRAKIQLDLDQEDFWWTRLQSPEKRYQAERMLLRRDFRSVLGRLSRIRSLFLDFHLGMIGPILRLKCDEEILHGWRRIESCWWSLLGGSQVAFDKLEHKDVKMLELRCPAMYGADRRLLEPLFKNGEVLHHFSPAERDQVWHRLLEYQALVPSFFSFFENLKYLCSIADCLKKLVSLDHGQTLADALEEAFSGGSDGDSNYDSERDSSCSFSQSRANIAYRQLVVYVMQQLELLRPQSILTGIGPKLPTALGGAAKRELAVVAEQFGFRSALITELLASDPDRQTARQALLAARATIWTDCSEARMTPLIDQMAALFRRFRQQTVSSSALVSLATDDDNSNDETKLNDVDQRRGSPLRQDHAQSCHSLTFAQIHASTTPNVDKPTPFLVRRDIYLFFYGELRDSVTELETVPKQRVNPKPTEGTRKDTREDTQADTRADWRMALASSPDRDTILGDGEEAGEESSTTAILVYDGPDTEIPITPAVTESQYTVSRV